MNRWANTYNTCFKRKLSEDEAKAMEQLIKSRCPDVSQDQIISALEALSSKGEYADKQLPATDVIHEIRRIMNQAEVESLDDGCPICDFKGIMFVETTENSGSLPCKCALGDYKRENCKPWKDLYGSWKEKLSDAIDYWHRMKKEGRMDIGLIHEELERRVDAYWKSIGKKPDQYVDKSTIVVPPSGPAKMGSEDECDF